MKTLTTTLFLFLIIVIGCHQPNRNTNQFSSRDHELTLKTNQEKGLGLWMYFASLNALNFSDSALYEVITPSELTNISYAYEVVDYNILAYKKFIASGKEVNKYYSNLISESKIDTSNLLSFKDNSICILEAIKGQDTIFMVDQNNNKDFRDDTIRFWKELDPFAKDLVKVDFRIYNGEEYVTSSNWVNFGLWEGLKQYLSHQHYTADFQIDTSYYKIDIFIQDCRFNFMDPRIAIRSQLPKSIEAVSESDVIQIGEVLKLKEGYYKFASLTNDGSLVGLIKEDDFDSKIGLQPGMIAPDFKATTVNGNQINLNNFLDKPVLVANISGCAPETYQDFETILEKTKGNLNIIGLEYGIDNDLGGTMINVEDALNNDIYKKYRNAFSSYNCYLINTDGRIENRFLVYNWMPNLKGYINK